MSSFACGMADMPTAATTRSNTLVLSLDGGGAKGVYTLGILAEIEALLGGLLLDHVDLIYGTSTGAIIATLIAAGYSVDKITSLYLDLVPEVMSHRRPKSKSIALRRHIDKIFGIVDFTSINVPIGIVATNELNNTVLVFKSRIEQAHGRRETFIPGFGCTVAEAIMASSAAYPYFEKQRIITNNYGEISLIDGGYSVNNPTLLAIADCVNGLGVNASDLRVISLGVGRYPVPRNNPIQTILRNTWPMRLFETTLSSSTNTIEQLRKVLFPDVRVVRIDESYTARHLSTDFVEKSPEKLLTMHALGRQSYGVYESELRRLLFN